MRPKSDVPRVNGPYKHGRKWRVQFAIGSGAARKAHYETFDTRAAAEACIDGARDEAQGSTVKLAIEQFLAEKRAAGKADATVSTYRDRLVALLGPILTRPLRTVRTRGEELYKQVQTGRSADTHQNALVVGRQWGKWCVKRKLLRENPFADVEPVGRRTLGADKPRLTVDESRTLDVWCRARPGDPVATIALAYLLLGTRASELVLRDVRDLDDNGRLLWIRRAKSAAGRRRLAIPDELRAMLLILAQGRKKDAPLFAHPDGSRWTRQLARIRAIAACEAAGVPPMGPQALRRTQSTLATEAGETALAVARHLGHATGEAPAVTGRAYVGRQAAADAKRERVLRVIQGGRR
jgi:integrase